MRLPATAAARHAAPRARAIVPMRVSRRCCVCCVAEACRVALRLLLPLPSEAVERREGRMRAQTRQVLRVFFVFIRGGVMRQR